MKQDKSNALAWIWCLSNALNPVGLRHWTHQNSVRMHWICLISLKKVNARCRHISLTIRTRILNFKEKGFFSSSVRGHLMSAKFRNRGVLEVVSSKWNKAVLEPRVSPAFAITYLCNHCNIRFENTSKYVDTLTLFSKNLNQRSLTPRWPLTPCLLRSHVWLYPRIIVSKSHDNTSMYVDTMINFAKYHIHTHTTVHTYYVHTTYILRTEWVIT